MEKTIEELIQDIRNATVGDRITPAQLADVLEALHSEADSTIPIEVTEEEANRLMDEIDSTLQT